MWRENGEAAPRLRPSPEGAFLSALLGAFSIGWTTSDNSIYVS
jgi:hypothetical protein